MMNKQQISNRAESSLSVSGRDVARVSRGPKARYLTMRHVWPESVDARVWHGVKAAAMDLAQEIANKTGRAVEIYAAEGWVIEQVTPERP